MPVFGTVSGRERRRGGEWAPFRGTVWGEHAATNMMAHTLAHRWLRFVGHSGKWTVSYQELFTPKRWTRQSFGWLVVRHGSKVLSSSLSAKLTQIKSRRESAAPHHRVPTRYRIQAQTDTGPLELTVRVGKSLHREDVLEPLPSLIRSVIEMFIQPVIFYARARFELKIGSKTVRGQRGVSVYTPLTAR